MDTVGVNVIEIAALGRPFQLGMLYDCRKDALIPGITLWDLEKLQQSIRTSPHINTNSKVTASDSIKEKSSLLKIDGSLKLSLLGGLVSVKGAAEYLNDTKTSFKQQRLTLHYHSTSRYEELTMNHLASENLVYHDVFDKDMATHVVTAVLYGADACFVFDREVSADEKIKTVEGEAKVALEKLKFISDLDANINLEMNDTQKNAVQKFTCTFYGDFQLPSNQTSFKDALKAFTDLPKLLGENKELAVPLRVWLHPLDKLHSKASKLQKDISMDLIIKTESVIESLNTTEMKCSDLLKDSPASTFAEFQNKIKQMKQNCYEYRLRLMKRLGSLLPNIRGDVMKETALNDLLQEHDGSPFSENDLAEWLKERERESDIIKPVLRQLKDAGAQVEVNLDAVLMDLGVGNLVCYTFTSLDWTDVLLPKQTTYLSPSTKGETAENILDSEQKTWLSPEIQRNMKSNLKMFRNLMDSEHCKPARFIVSSREMKNNLGSCILLYESECDEAVCCIPPSKPVCPDTEEVKDKGVVVKVPPACPATVELRLQYKPKQDSDWSSETVMKDQHTVTLINLRAETEYELRCAAVGKFNYTVYSDVTEIDKEGRVSMITVPCGLINYGMTGYLNSVLQVLFMTDKFRDHVLRLGNEVTAPEENILHALADLFRSLMHEQKAVSTTEVTKALNITNVPEPRDAAEYLQMILDKIPKSSEFFRGIMVTSTVCSGCSQTNEEETDFLSIPLSINNTEHLEVALWTDKLRVTLEGPASHPLVPLFEEFIFQNLARNDIKKWPDILTLQLKRLEMKKYTQTGFNYWKNEAEIRSRIQVRSVNYEVYDLYAIINQYGSYSSGYNDAVIKDESGNWYHFNNHTVTKIHNTYSQWINDSSSSACLLMYRKVSSSKMFKLRLKEEFQFLNKEISPRERQVLNDIFIERHITEEPYSHTSEEREIMCNNIFEGEKIRTVLLKGDAGTGKTVTVQKFILDWAEEKSNTHIDYIYPITFQKLSIIRETVKKCSFMELLQQCFENTEHLKPDSDRIMLVFDGLNEFKHPLDFQNTKKMTDIHDPASVSDLLINLIMRNLLPNAQIWITSRPAAANQIPDGFIDRVTEIQGFDDQQKEEYFRKSISDQRMSDKVIRHIQTSPRISSMCYLPDYCRIIAAIPEEMFSTGRDDFPKTLTQMYSRLLLAQTELMRERRETIIALGRIAFHLLENRNTLFCYEDLKKCGIRDIIMTNSSIIKITEDKSKRKSLCFVNHRTQEFLAALYATDVINGKTYSRLIDLSSLNLEYGEDSFTHYTSLQKMMENTLQKQMDLFFCFLLGLTLASSQRALKNILTQREIGSSSSQDTVQHIKTLIMNSCPETADKCSLLFDALKELDDRYLIQQIKTSLKSELSLSAVQFSAPMFVLLNSEKYLDEIKSHILTSGQT